MNITEVSIMDVKVGQQIIIVDDSVKLENGKAIMTVATVTREARDAGLERWVKLLAVDGAGVEHKQMGWRDDCMVLVISE